MKTPSSLRGGAQSPGSCDQYDILLLSQEYTCT